MYIAQTVLNRLPKKIIAQRFIFNKTINKKEDQTVPFTLRFNHVDVSISWSSF